jgi:Phage portal protein
MAGTPRPGATVADGRRSAIDPGIIAAAANGPGFLRRLTAGVRYIVLGADAPGSFFGPQQPIVPMAQEESAGAVGRQFDYPAGFNLRQTPRLEESLDFPTLKGLADSYDVLRLVIETRKDQVAGATWSIGPKDRAAKRDDALCDALEDFFRMPDKEHTWPDWIRMVLEQLFVYDAPAFFCQPDRKGDLFALRVLDGATIKRVLTLHGRTPLPEEGPAYQQILKGIPAVDYIKPMPFGVKPPMGPDGWPMPELIYKPRNPRVDRVYGFGPVEQIVTTVNIALRRELSQLDYYTKGSTPDLIFQTPEGWNPNQISQFSQWWESMLAGNLENRRGAMFVPQGVTPYDTKDRTLKDEYDEWLVRIVCFAFSITPTPFVKQMNRATAQSQHEQSIQEGLAPIQKWIVDLVEMVIRAKFGRDDVTLRWDEDEAIDPLEQAQIFAIYGTNKIYHPDEIRQKLGEDPMPDEMRMEMDQPPFSAAMNAQVLPETQKPEPASDPAPGIDPKAAPAVAAKALGKGHRSPSNRSSRPGRLY